MIIKTTLSGAYPRIGDSPELQKLRRAYSDFETGKMSRDNFKSIEDEFVKLAIKEQEEAGIDIVTDGLIRWYDPISHFSKVFEGIRINGLLRFFDTNTYFRQPITETESLKPTKSAISDEINFAKDITKKILKAVITGPYTLAKHTKTKNFEKILSAYTDSIASEVELLDKTIKEIQIDEPSVLRSPEEIDLAKTSLDKIYKVKKNSKILLHFYFYDPAKIYTKLLELPCDILGLDFTYSEKLKEVVLAEGTNKPLMLGLFDGRNTYIEKEREVIPTIESIAKKLKTDFIEIGTSCGLEYLPRSIAFLKLKRISEIKEILMKTKK